MIKRRLEVKIIKYILLSAAVIMMFAAAACAAGGNAAKSAASSSAADMGGNSSMNFKIINAKEAKKMIDAGGVIIVDVRRPDEFAASHLKGAINIPNETISSEKPSALPDTGATILVYCRTGIRAADAAGKLTKLGYTNIYDMGGIVDWPYETVK
jgi:phage shock protein E